MFVYYNDEPGFLHIGPKYNSFKYKNSNKKFVFRDISREICYSQDGEYKTLVFKTFGNKEYKFDKMVFNH